MFEDLIVDKGIDVNNRRISNQCPYCSSFYIHKYAIQVALDDKYRQKAKCTSCQKEWTLVYSEDMSNVHIRYDYS